MRFEHRELLWYALLLVPALIAFFLWSWRRRKELIAQFVQSRLLAHLTVGVSARRQRLRMALLVAACGLAMVVLARPQWGFSFEEARQRGLDVIVAIDTSRSMLAEDVAPNRLARAKLAALDLKRLARTDRVGLIAFAGSAFLQCPLSFDDEAFRQNVNALDVSIIPQGGSALAEAMEAARAAFEHKGDNHRVLVLFSDGEDNVGEAIDVAKKAAKEGLRIFTVGVGTAHGELLRTTDGKGRTDYIRDQQGNVVKSRLDEKLLKDIAQAADGFYMLMAGANTMELLYERGLAPLPKSDQTVRHIKRYHERYQWFLGMVIVLLLTEMFLPERKRVRRPAATTAPALAKAAIFVLCVGALGAGASPARGLKQYDAGRYESAWREYRNALRDKPDDPRLHFNAGTAAYQAGNYEKALEYFSSAMLTPDPNLQQRAYYNRGNALYRFGEATSEPKEKMQHWDEAVSAYESALKLNPNDADAKFNQELVRQKLEELKKQQQQQQQQDQSKDDQNKDEKKDKQDQQKKEEQQKQDQSKPSDQSKEQREEEKQEQQQQQQQAQKEEQQKKEQSKQSQAQKGDKDQQQPEGEGDPMRAMQMTPQQAAQLLDMQKAEERAMIFLPQFKTNRNMRTFKDW